MRCISCGAVKQGEWALGIHMMAAARNEALKGGVPKKSAHWLHPPRSAWNAWSHTSFIWYDADGSIGGVIVDEDDVAVTLRVQLEDDVFAPID